MSTPTEFELFQAIYSQFYNRRVRETFRDGIPDDDFESPEGLIRNNCLIRDNDSAQMMILKSLFFFFMREDFKNFQTEVFGIPTWEYQESVIYSPQVILMFEETKEDAKRKKRRPVRARVSFRLMGETPETITQAEVERLKTEIKTNFPRTYKFKKGRYKASYRDVSRGYQMIFTSYTIKEAKELVRRVLAVNNHTPDWANLTNSSSEKNYNTETYTTVLGERHKNPSRRPIAEVMLVKAELHLFPRTIVLYQTYN